MTSKQCRACGDTKQLGEFYKCNTCKTCDRKRRAALQSSERGYWQRVYNKYGLTKDTWHELWLRQGERCAVCRGTDCGGIRGWQVDHCHTSKRTRGILCWWCNNLLGSAQDNPQILNEAVRYLESFRVKSVHDTCIYRTCTGCQQTKMSSEFWLDRGKPAARCIECASEYHKVKYQRNKERIRWREIFRRYGVTKDQWLEAWKNQGECCGCCLATAPRGGKWHTDHDHATLRFRGVLCLLCNKLLGGARDNTEYIRFAILYLEYYAH